MKYYTVKEFAKKFRVSENAIYDLVKKGEIKKVEGLGRTVRIPSSELKVKLEAINKEKRFYCNQDKVQIIDTHLGQVRKIKGKDEFITADLAKILGLCDSYKIIRILDENNFKKLNRDEVKELELPVNQFGVIVNNYEGIKQYCKKAQNRKNINFEKLLNELKVNDYEQVKSKEVEDKPIKLINVFEGHKVETIQENDQVLFELYSTGMALGYSTSPNPKGVIYPNRKRIDKVVENGEISICSRGVSKYLTEEMLYDFMLEAKTEKCKSFRKWVTNEVLPTIRKSGGYVDNTNKFTDFYFSNLSLEVRQAIKKELVNRNNEILIRTKQLETESAKLKHEYDINQKAMEQLNV
ncbi:MAG: BRO family protein [uncultured Clostridium sp.]